MNRLLRKKEAGGVIVIATIVAAIMMVLGAAFFLVTLAFVNSVEASVTDERTLQVAEAGIDIAIQQLNSGYPAQIALGTCGHGKYTVSAAYWGTDGADNDSDGQTDETDEQGIVVVNRPTDGLLGRQRSCNDGYHFTFKGMPGDDHLHLIYETI